jgi:hypothetical protein
VLIPDEKLIKSSGKDMEIADGDSWKDLAYLSTKPSNTLANCRLGNIPVSRDFDPQK